MEEAPDFHNHGGGEYSAQGAPLKLMYGFATLQNPEGKHIMEDFVAAEFREVNDRHVAYFGLFDGHAGADVAQFLQRRLFEMILEEGGLWVDPAGATRDAYLAMDREICQQQTSRKHVALLGGSTAVTAMVELNSGWLVVANVGDSRAILFGPTGMRQLSIDHDPMDPVEHGIVEAKGGAIIDIPGDLPRVDGKVKVTRVFGDGETKRHLSCKPDIVDADVALSRDKGLLLMSDGVWRALEGNKVCVDILNGFKDPQTAASTLLTHVLKSGNMVDDASCVVVFFEEAD